MKGYISQVDEWLYPDTDLGPIEDIKLHTALNGEEGIQLLLATNEKTLITYETVSKVSIDSYEMIDVYVGYNEIENEVQDGQFVILEKDYEKPAYCTRKAPFRVYEALEKKESFQPKNSRIAVYMTFRFEQAGEHVIQVKANGVDLFKVNCQVYPAMIPKQSLQVANWLNLDNVSSYHGDHEMTSQSYYDMLRLYAKKMKRLRQTHFYIQFDPLKIPLIEGHYDFTFYKPIIELFFEEGLQVLELAYLAMKKPHLFTSDLKCAFDESLKVSSDEGYKKMTLFIKDLRSFLDLNGWMEKVVFHICDEPDVHVNDQTDIQKRMLDYMQVACLIKKFIPKAKIIEAVKSPSFRAAIDTWVPLSANYEEFKDLFDDMKAHGDDIWTYVCCVPSGHHLNRFLDIDLIKSRLIFWALSKYNIQGYLHWGLNQQPISDFDPFENSNTPNVDFDGLFPSGDAFILYPGKEGPLMGMRFEVQRKGAEDYELLNHLKSHNYEAYQTIMDRVVRSFSDYNSDVRIFEEIRIEILELLSQPK